MTEDDVGTPGLSRDEYKAVFNFSKVMLEKLLKNKHKGGWKGSDPQRLITRVHDEFVELRSALTKYVNLTTSEVASCTPAELSALEGKIEIQRQAVVRECADIANFCVMLADVIGGLDE